MNNQADYSKLLSDCLVANDPEAMTVLIDKVTLLEEKQKALEEKLALMDRIFRESELLVNNEELQLSTSNLLGHIVLRAIDTVAHGDNMYAIEEGKSGVYRWVGPDRLTKFELPIDRSEDKTLILRLISEIEEGVYKTVKIYIDGVLCECDYSAKKGVMEIVANIPKCQKSRDTLVAVFCPRIIRPCDINPDSKDLRKVSVAFKEIEVV
ncbi:hypothetical protein MAH1_35100 [Sessilibacter sp. MAH1]